MVNGLHLYSAFIQSTVQFMPLIHPFTHTHQRRLDAMQGTNQLVRSNWVLGVLLRDTSTCGGSNRQPSDCQTTTLPPEPYRPHSPQSTVHSPQSTVQSTVHSPQSNVQHAYSIQLHHSLIRNLRVTPNLMTSLEYRTSQVLFQIYKTVVIGQSNMLLIWSSGYVILLHLSVLICFCLCLCDFDCAYGILTMLVGF